MDLFGITGLEYIGYLASLMVLLSFIMKTVKTLRLVNMMGCILFIIYGFLMPSLRIGLPIIIANTAILLVNFYYLIYGPGLEK
ncbi:uroporphyrinogen decarboxylase [Aestuariivivens sediminis]|uniref:uroporphyrinogen decarboxylase n=1 Tax=Aestuariivivens sediminis TaxID=2913557 RepID=UPI001F57247A|nr:uroporphyrinogen decarboxylase [Aestuariivivens sediminis]